MVIERMEYLVSQGYTHGYSFSNNSLMKKLVNMLDGIELDFVNIKDKNDNSNTM